MIVNLKELQAYAKRAEKKSEIPFGKSLTTKLTGVMFEGRQEFIKLMTEATPIKLERERSNEHDCNAVAVKAFLCDMWLQIGYIPKAINKELALILDKGLEVRAATNGIHGGKETEEGNKMNYGVSIKVDF